MSRACAAMVAMALAGCGGLSDDEAARAAYRGSPLAACYKRAHWLSASRFGAITSAPGGLGFVPLDSRLPRSNIQFGVTLTGAAKALLDRPLTAFRVDYARAGSPISPPDPMSEATGLGQRLFAASDSGRGFIKGNAHGWVSREDDIYCPGETRGGRIFLIDRFEPAFPVSISPSRR
jgi:hypothetical protein